MLSKNACICSLYTPSGKPGMLQSLGSQRVRDDLATEQQQCTPQTRSNGGVRWGAAFQWVRGDNEREEVRGHFSDLATLPLVTHHGPFRTAQLSQIPGKALHDQKGVAGSRLFGLSSTIAPPCPDPRPGPPKRDLLGVKQCPFWQLKLRLFSFLTLWSRSREWRQVPFTAVGGACWWPLPCLVRYPLANVIFDTRACLVAQTVKNLPAMWETHV